ncbi:MAG: c-type cytochrome [Bacteriovorax sp.]|jgi:mono/diheme cytochrome c family protein
MSENKEPGMAYSMPKLHKVMAILSFIFFVTTVWMFLDDYIKPWKAIQIEALQIKRQHTEDALKAARKDIDAKKLAELNSSLAKGEEIVISRKKDIEKTEKELKVVQTKMKAQTIENGVFNGDVSAVNFQYETAVANHDHKLIEKKLEELTKLKAGFDIGKDNLKALQAQEKEISAKLLELYKEVVTSQKEIKDITMKVTLLEAAKATTDFNPIFALRNMPFLDYLDPTIKIQQLVINNVTDDRYFRQVPKVDRCTTCHTFIDQPGYEKEKQPFRTHPKLDLMVGLESKHPMKVTGCTACHGGEGQRVTDFASVAHTPDSPKQEQEWVKKYGWKAPHHIASPMFSRSQTEAGCVKCHSGVELIPGATVLNEGRMAIEKNGCYACHKIEGWGENKRKPGPSLLKIAGKVDKEWFKSWVWEPKSFNKHAKMPAFFRQSNNSKPEFVRLNVTEVNAIAEYVWDKSKPYAATETFRPGNAENGKKIISEVGCLGCHGVDGLEDQSNKVKAYAGPWLSGLGSKVQPDWLVTWLKKPNHYQEDTIMPSLRLTDGEANDIATYLLSLRNKSFEDLKFAKFDLKARDELLTDYLSAFDTQASAAAKVAKMNDREKTLDLGKRSIGKYGCFSCHNIEGFDGFAPIGPELTKEGSKPLTQFFFGIQHQVPHARDGWITAHLQNPRMWDIGIDKVFRDLNRMPNFYMNEAEAKKITVALLGQTSDVVPLAGRKRYSAGEALYNDAMKVAGKYNCMGCHQIDGLRGDILRSYADDINQGPPRLVGQGHRVQTDWLYHFLQSPTPIRPWLSIRMPTFNLSTEEKNKIVAGFQQGSKQPTFEEPQQVVQWEPGEREGAVKLWNAYNCVSCHSIGFTKDTPLAPDLHKAAKRLRPSWIKLWITNPQNILPGTTMPSFFGDDGKTPIEPGVFGGDAEKQINALTKYVLEFGL